MQEIRFNHFSTRTTVTVGGQGIPLMSQDFSPALSPLSRETVMLKPVLEALGFQMFSTDKREGR